MQPRMRDLAGTTRQPLSSYGGDPRIGGYGPSGTTPRMRSGPHPYAGTGRGQASTAYAGLICGGLTYGPFAPMPPGYATPGTAALQPPAPMRERPGPPPAP